MKEPMYISIYHDYEKVGFEPDALGGCLERYYDSRWGNERHGLKAQNIGESD